MTFKYNGVEPTKIIYNGTEVFVLKYGTQAVWGKPFTLSISAGANSSITVSRTSSPNQNASTGTLSNGAKIYYGDVLRIQATASSGYNIDSLKVNNSTFTSGNTTTVTGAISVTSTAVSAASWKLAFLGTIETNFTDFGTIDKYVPNVNASYPTRINCEYEASSLFQNVIDKKNYTNLNLPGYLVAESTGFEFLLYIGVEIRVQSSNTLRLECYGNLEWDEVNYANVLISRVEQYK